MRALKNDKGNAIVVPFQIRILPQFSAGMQCTLGICIENGKLFTGDKAGDLSALLCPRQFSANSQTKLAAFSTGTIPVNQLHNPNFMTSGFPQFTGDALRNITYSWKGQLQIDDTIIFLVFGVLWVK